MPTLADYEVIHACAFRLSHDPGPQGALRHWKDFSFDVPQNLVLGTNKAQLIFQFEVQPTERTKLKIFVNNNVISKETYSESVTRMVQVIFPFTAAVPENCIKPDLPVRFELDGGDMWIKDVVLWYQVKT